jgi:hypothetical protein
MPIRCRAIIPLLLLALAIAGCAQQQPAAQGTNAAGCGLDSPQYADGIGMNTTLLAIFQDNLMACMDNGSAFDNARALSLMDSFVSETATGISQLDSANPLLSNNLAIRNDLLRMLVMQRMNASYAPDFGPVLAKIHKYGFKSDGYTTWYEGSGYLIYTLAAVRQANTHFDNAELRDFETSSVRWLGDFALPDGTLAPIGDTALDEKCAFCTQNASDRVVFTDHETAVVFGNGTGYLLFRHPLNNTAPASAIRNDLHTQFDFGSLWLWYNGSWLIRPIGYPDYALKTSSGLDDKYDYNIQSADRIGGDFTQADFNNMDALRYLGSWRAVTASVIPADAVQRNDYPDRYELSFSYSLNSGPGGTYENYSRKVLLYKGRNDLEIIDDGPQNASSYIMVSENVNVTSSSGVTCDDGGKWSPAWGVVNGSRRCAIGPGPTLDYSVRWQ